MSAHPEQQSARVIEQVPAPLLLLLALVLIQIGTGFSKDLVTTDNALSVAFVRMTLGTIALWLIVRPPVWRWTRSQWIDTGILGVVFTGFVVSFFVALPHLPIGLVATIGFLGPLGVSLFGARRALDYLWPAMGLAGVALLASWDPAATVALSGVLLGLVYAVAWAFYVLASARSGRSTPGLQGYTVATAITALLLAPFGAMGVPVLLASPAALAQLLLITLLSTLPLTLEYLALKRISPRAFGVLLSLEPGIATLTGLIMLGEQLTAMGWLALALVSLASLGVTLFKPQL